MKHKTGCNMWVDQRALKLTITGPDLSSVEHAAKSVDAYVAAAPIKAGAVEAAVTKTLECPPQLLDDLGDRTTIARIVKETHAQVVVNKKIGRIIVRGDPRSVELAYASVQAMIHHAMHGGFGLGLGLRVDTPDSHASYGPGGPGGYFPDGALSSSSRGGGGGGGGRSPLDGAAAAATGAGMHHMMLHTSGGSSGGGGGGGGGSHLGGPDYLDHRRHQAGETPEFRHLGPWQEEQRLLELKPELTHQQHQQLQRHAQQHQHQHHLQHHSHHGGRGGSDTDESEIETVSLGSIGARTPVSSTAGSPRVPGSYNTSPALSGTASTPVGDWSLFSGGFGLGMAALEEGETASSRDTTPTTARTTPRVHFPEGLRALGDGGTETGGGGGTNSVLQGSGLLSPASGNDAGESTSTAGRKPAGSLAPPPSPASTAGGEASRKMLGLPMPDASALSALEGEDSDEEEGSGEGEGDVSDRVAGLGKLLQAMGLGKYCHKFAENEVDLEALGLMSESDLADIGIPKGPRLKILNAVGARAASAAAAATASHAPAV
ncbi:unnamed protein product [Hapterophycus canaliculatus]